MIQLATTVFLARRLGPGEFGVAAVIVVIAGASELMRESGVSSVVVQRKELSPPILHSIHFRWTGAGFAVALLACASGPILSSAIGDSRYVVFAGVLAPTFVLAAMSAVPVGLMARNLRFRTMAVGEASCGIFGCAVAITGAILGWGAYALVLMPLATATAFWAWIWASCPWRPRLSKGEHAPAEGVWGFILNVSLVQVLNYGARSVDNVVVASAFGTRIAGMYNQAYQLMAIPLQQINGPIQRVGLPAFSRTVGTSAFRRYYRSVSSIVAYALWTIYGVLFVYCESVIDLLFGEAWSGSAAIFRVLAIGGAVQAIGYVVTWAFIASGQVTRQTVWALVARPITIGSFFIGVPWGALGVASALTVTSAVLVIPGFLIVRRRAGLLVRDLYGPLAWPTVYVAIVVVSATALHRLISPEGIGRLMLNLVVVFAVAMATGFLVRPVRREVLMFLERARRSDRIVASELVDKESLPR